MLYELDKIFDDISKIFNVVDSVSNGSVHTGIPLTGFHGISLIPVLTHIPVNTGIEQKQVVLYH